MNTHAAPPPPTAIPAVDIPAAAIPPGAIEATILALATQRGPAKSICPSEVARALRPNWQSLLTEVRRIACRMAAAGQIDILRKGQAVEPVNVKGVIRLRLAQLSSPWWVVFNPRKAAIECEWKDLDREISRIFLRCSKQDC